MPTICSETCVGRLRHLGIVLIDSDRVQEAASVRDEKDLIESQLSLFLDPEDPDVRSQAARDGVPDDWIDAARRSPVYALCKRFRVALPLHPEFRTLPMVWYVPPLSPVESLVEETIDPGVGTDEVFGGDRGAAHPGRVHRRLPVGRAIPSRCASRCAGWPRCGASCAAGTSAARAIRRSPKQWA